MQFKIFKWACLAEFINRAKQYLQWNNVFITLFLLPASSGKFYFPVLLIIRMESCNWVLAFENVSLWSEMVESQNEWNTFFKMTKFQKKKKKKTQPRSLSHSGDMPRKATWLVPAFNWTEIYIFVAIKHKGKYSVSLVIQEMQIKITIRFHYLVSGMTKILKDQ